MCPIKIPRPKLALRPGSRSAILRWCSIDSTQIARQLPPVRSRRLSAWSSGDFHDVAGGVATPLLEQVEAFQGGLIACDKQDGGLPIVAVDVLEPGTTGHCQIIEFFPIETLAVDDRVSLALERSDQQARSLADRTSFLARAQHLREECHGLEHRAAAQRVGVFDRQRLVGIAIPVEA